MATSIYQRRMIDKRVSNKQCVNCGNQLDRDGYYCSFCNDKKNRDNRETKNTYIRYHVCPECRKERLYGEEKRCVMCSARNYEITMRSRERLGREHYNEVHAKWSKNTHAKRIELGICTRCGKREANDGYKTCSICRSNIREYKRRTDTRPNRKERYLDGKCYFCDNDIIPGFKVCKEHYQDCLDRLDNSAVRDARQKIKKNMNIKRNEEAR